MPPNLQGGDGDVVNVAFDQVQPSGTFVRSQFGGFSIAYPQNWKAGGDSNSIVIAPPSGVLQSGIAYGVLISGFTPEASASKELDVAINELIADIEQTNPDLRLYSSLQAIQLGNHTARRLEWTGKSAVQENGEPLKERVRLIALPGKSGVVLYAVFVAPDPDFNGLWPTFERMLNSLQVK